MRKNPVLDSDIADFLTTRDLDLTATTDQVTAFTDADYIIVATPTNYDVDTNYFDTSNIEAVVEMALALNDTGHIVIKSTIPVGFTERLRTEHNSDRIMFSPEFLREGRALYDNLHPSRIIVGATTLAAHIFADLLVRGAVASDIATD